MVDESPPRIPPVHLFQFDAAVPRGLTDGWKELDELPLTKPTLEIDDLRGRPVRQAAADPLVEIAFAPHAAASQTKR
jgi:hypothetical protein